MRVSSGYFRKWVLHKNTNRIRSSNHIICPSESESERKTFYFNLNFFQMSSSTLHFEICNSFCIRASPWLYSLDDFFDGSVGRFGVGNVRRDLSQRKSSTMLRSSAEAPGSSLCAGSSSVFAAILTDLFLSSSVYHFISGFQTICYDSLEC